MSFVTKPVPIYFTEAKSMPIYFTEAKPVIKKLKSFTRYYGLGLRLICQHNFKNNRSQFWQE